MLHVGSGGHSPETGPAVGDSPGLRLLGMAGPRGQRCTLPPRTPRAGLPRRGCCALKLTENRPLFHFSSGHHWPEPGASSQPRAAVLHPVGPRTSGNLRVSGPGPLTWQVGGPAARPGVSGWVRRGRSEKQHLGAWVPAGEARGLRPAGVMHRRVRLGHVGRRAPDS